MIAPTGQPPEPNEADAFLLGDSIASMTPGLLTSSAAAVVDRKKIEVSWLRRTEYLSSEISSKSIGTGGFGLVLFLCLLFSFSGVSILLAYLN